MRTPSGYTLERREQVDSTNALALRLAAAGAPHGTVVLANAQTAGRGRRGRAWISLSGNLFLSILVRPPEECALGQLSFVAALALSDALDDISGIALKWPNDVLLDGKKIAGVLIEADGGAAAVGIGVNLVAAPDGFAATASDLGGCLERDTIAEGLCWAFDEWYRHWVKEGFASLRTAWLDRAAGLDGQVVAGTRSGKFVDLDPSGGLVMVDDTGRQSVVTAGEVFFGDPPCC